MKHCTQCGKQVSNQAKFCNHCGNQLRTSGRKTVVLSQQTKKNQSQHNYHHTQEPKNVHKKRTLAVGQIPEGFWPLLGFILREAWRSFLRQLPMSLAIAAGLWIFHVYVVAVLLEGINANSTLLASFFSIKGQIISGTLIFFIISALITGLIRRSNASGALSFGARIAVVRTYFRASPPDAFIVLAAGVGLSLATSGLLNVTGSLFAALGVGVALASRAGALLAMLFRALWMSVFTALRRDNAVQYAMAAGYVTLLAVSLGFVVSIMIGDARLSVGTSILAGTVVLALMRSGFSAAMILLGVTIAAYAVFFPDVVLADDGGWAEASCSSDGVRLICWVKSSGAISTLIFSLPPAIATAFGAVFSNVLIDLSRYLPESQLVNIEPKTNHPLNELKDVKSRGPTFYDKEGEPFERNEDGQYRAPDDKGEWRWQNEVGAKEAEAALRREKLGRDREQAHHDSETQKNLERSRQKIRAQIEAEQEAEAAWLAEQEERKRLQAAADKIAEKNRQQTLSDVEKILKEATENTTTQEKVSLDDDESQDSNSDWSSSGTTDWWQQQREKREQRLRNNGMELDPYQDAWRKPPDSPKLDDLPGAEPGSKSKPKLEKWGEDFSGLDRVERKTQSKYQDLERQIETAEKNGDKWFAERLRKNQDKVRGHLDKIRNKKRDVIAQIKKENRRIIDFNNRIKNATVGKAVGQLWDQLWDGIYQTAQGRDPNFEDSIKKGIAAANKVREGEGIELKPNLTGISYTAVKTGPSIADNFNDELNRIKTISGQLDDANERGDKDAVDRLTKELKASMNKAKQLSQDLQQHEKNKEDWKVKSSWANLSAAKKGMDIAEGVVEGMGMARTVSNVMQGDFGLSNHRVFKGESDPDIDWKLNKGQSGRRGQPGAYGDGDIDLDLPTKRSAVQSSNIDTDGVSNLRSRGADDRGATIAARSHDDNMAGQSTSRSHGGNSESQLPTKINNDTDGSSKAIRQGDDLDSQFGTRKQGDDLETPDKNLEQRRATTKKKLEESGQKLDDAERKLKEAENALKNTPQDSDEYWKKYADHADAQNSKTMAERNKLEAEIRARDAQDGVPDSIDNPPYLNDEPASPTVAGKPDDFNSQTGAKGRDDNAIKGESESSHPPGYDANDSEIQSLEARRQGLVENRDRLKDNLKDSELQEINERIANIDQEIENHANGLQKLEGTHHAAEGGFSAEAVHRMKHNRFYRVDSEGSYIELTGVTAIDESVGLKELIVQVDKHTGKKTVMSWGKNIQANEKIGFWNRVKEKIPGREN
jgi:hypothetical protein